MTTTQQPETELAALAADVQPKVGEALLSTWRVMALTAWLARVPKERLQRRLDVMQRQLNVIYSSRHMTEED